MFLITSIIGMILMVLFTIVQPFSLLYFTISGVVSYILLKKTDKKRMVLSVTLGSILLWVSILTTYRVPEKLPDGVVALAGFPLSAFHYPDALHRFDLPPWNNWITFHVDYLIYLVIGFGISFLYRKQISKIPKWFFVGIVVLAGIISIYGLVLSLGAFEG